MHLLNRNSIRYYLLTASLAALLGLPASLLAQTLSDTPWTEYFGSSSGPHIGWGRTSRVQNNKTRQVRKILQRGDDIVLGDVLGLGSAENEAAVAQFMNSIEADGGQSFKQQVLDRAMTFNQTQIDVGATDQVLYWQFGNEITSVKYTLNLRSWAGQPVQPAKPSDPFVIPYYAEYYLAPAVQAIREAEIVTGIDNLVLLGSIGNASSPPRREFLNELLNYELVGTYAGEFAGLRVADIIDLIDIHYLIAKDTHVENARGRPIRHLQGSYELALNEIFDPWVDTGIVGGLFSTEEVGRKAATGGYGASKAMVVAARFLHWWGANGLSSDQARSLLFGTNLGPSDISADLAMQTLLSFLGAVPLVEIPDAIVPPANDWEGYLFESVDDNNKRVGFIIPSWSDIENGTFTSFEIDAAGWPGRISAEVIVYGVGASSNSNASVNRQNNVLTITVPTPITAQKGRPPSIVILLQRN